MGLLHSLYFAGILGFDRYPESIVAKCWKWWRTVMCGGSILSCCPRNPHRYERALKEEEEEEETKFN